MEKKVIMLILIIVSSSGMKTGAQLLYPRDEERRAERQAATLMPDYQLELGLTEGQLVHFKETVEEFLIRRYEIEERRMPEVNRLALLQQLSQQETARMGNILTLPQLKYYRIIKKNLQPVLTGTE